MALPPLESTWSESSGRGLAIGVSRLGRTADLTDAEAAALFDAYDAEGGSYIRVDGASLVRAPAVARDPRLRGLRIETSMRPDGATLTLQVGDRTLRWVRVRQSPSASVDVLAS